MLRWLLLLMAALPALPCSCMSSGPPCEAAWKVDAVFFGKVVELHHDRKEPDSNGSIQFNGFLGTHALFEISESFRGITGGTKQIEIRTGMGGGDCGYPFKLGESYVVYARRSKDDLLVTSICSRTAPAERAEADLQYFHNFKANATNGYVYGQVSDGHSKPKYEQAERAHIYEPISGAVVTLTGGEGTRTLITGDDGAFRFDHVPPGTYQVSAAKEGYSSQAYWFASGAPKIQVHAGGCGFAPQFLVVDRRIVGTLVRADGQPAAGVQVEIVPTKPDEQHSLPFPAAEVKTDAEGHYELKNLRPGEYYLGINLARTPSKEMPYTRYFFPGAEDSAAAIPALVGDGQQIKKYDFPIPAAQKERQVEGFVFWPDGHPAENVDIFLEDPRWPWQTNVVLATTDAKGHFTVLVFDRTHYRIHAVSRSRFTNTANSAEPFPLNPDTDINQPLKLVLTRKGMSNFEGIGKGLERWRAGLGL